MKILTRNLVKLFIILLLMVSCARNKEAKMIIFSEYHKNILEEIIAYKNYDIKIINKGNFWIIKNISEEALLEIVGIARLKMDVVSNNIANADTEKYIRKYVKITVENAIEVLDDTESVDLIKETIDLMEIQRLYEASIEYLKKINENIIFM